MPNHSPADDKGEKNTRQYFRTPLRRNIEDRIPWLIIGLVGMSLSAQFISGFEKTLEKQIVLATFIPLVVYMADAIGTETETVFVRDLALDPNFSARRFVLKEIRTGFFLSLLCGAVMAAYSYLRFHSVYLGLVLAISLVFATLEAVLIGAFVPWAVNKIGKDPAVAVGPLSTVFQDMFSVITYFVTATLLLRLF